MESSIHQMSSALASVSLTFSVSSFISLHLSRSLSPLARGIVLFWKVCFVDYTKPDLTLQLVQIPIRKSSARFVNVEFRASSLAAIQAWNLQ